MRRLFAAIVLLGLSSLSLACQTPPPPAPTTAPTTPGPTATVVPTPAPTPTPRPYDWNYTVPRFGVAEAFRNDRSTELGISWERNVFSWSGIQPEGPDDWQADEYFPPQMIQRERDRGIEIVGVIQFTPKWAAARPEQGERSVPKNLALPADDPNNYWASFAAKLASHYKGRIDRWIIWNEPEFKPGDVGVGESYSWLGSDAEFYMLLKRGYQAIKKANPKATVVFSGTSYWVDVNMGRPTFFRRLLNVAAADPEASANGFFFDAVAFNLYRCPDDLYRIHAEAKALMKAKGIDKPVWITETNAMPYDDAATPKARDGQRVTMALQADYVIQGLAMAAAAGYEWLSWYRIDDGNIWREQEVWGLVRDDGSARPAFTAMKTALRLFTGARKISFVPLERSTQPFGVPWPADPDSYYPNWQIYQVVFDHPDGRRVTVLWNADGWATRVRMPKLGASAILVDKTGTEKPLLDVDGSYSVDLAAATAEGPLDPAGYHFIGGPPMVIVERGVPAGAPIRAPRVAD